MRVTIRVSSTSLDVNVRALGQPKDASVALDLAERAHRGLLERIDQHNQRTTDAVKSACKATQELVEIERQANRERGTE